MDFFIQKVSKKQYSGLLDLYKKEKEKNKQWEDKIKEKIEELDYKCNSNLERVYKKEVLQELLEEQEECMKQLCETAEKFEELFGNTPFENIEKIKNHIKDNYVSKNKIKEKIEEINNENLNYSESEYYLESEIKGYAIEHLQELLEE